MEKIYFISGLGADKRIFQKLVLPSGFQPVHVEWLKPFSNETLNAYVFRLSEQIDNNAPVTLVGVSFGGIIATLLSSIMATKKVVIISSLQRYDDLPLIYKWAGILQIHKIIPSFFLTKSNFFSSLIFGARQLETRILLKMILKDTDPFFLKWAINQILSYRDYPIPDKFFHIHGTADWVLPKVPDNAFQIKDGGHLMIFENAFEVNVILNNILLKN